MDLTAQQQSSLDESLQRGEAFLKLTLSPEWNYIKAYYENKIKALVNGLIVTDAEIEKFESERQQIKGLRKLFSMMETDIQALKKHNDGEH